MRAFKKRNSKRYWKKEFNRCKASVAYMYKNYWTVSIDDGIPSKPVIRARDIFFFRGEPHVHKSKLI